MKYSVCSSCSIGRHIFPLSSKPKHDGRGNFTLWPKLPSALTMQRLTSSVGCVLTEKIYSSNMRTHMLLGTKNLSNFRAFKIGVAWGYPCGDILLTVESTCESVIPKRTLLKLLFTRMKQESATIGMQKYASEESHSSKSDVWKNEQISR